jgi:hypothetical protein
MSLVEFIAAIAWPVAILVIAILYRAPLGKLVAGERTRLKAGPFEIAWDSARPDLPRPAPVAVDAGSGLSPPVGRLASMLVDLARKSPRDAVLTAYGRLGEALARGLKEVAVEVGASADDPLSLARRAERADVIGPEITHAIEGLNVLRDLAAHRLDPGVSEGRAFEFLAMTDAVLYSIASALAKYQARERAQPLASPGLGS